MGSVQAAAVTGTAEAATLAGGNQWGEGSRPRVGNPTRASAVHASAVNAVSNPRIAVKSSESVEETNCELVPQNMFRPKRKKETKT